MARSAVARRAAALALCLLGPAAGPAVCTIVPQEAWAPVPDGHRPPVVEWVGAVPPEAAELHAHPERFTELLESQGLLLDLSSRSVTARGGALHDAASLSYPVEYVLVTERGKTHEALFVLKAQPSLLDACLRAIGLHPGVPMRYVLRDPPPSAAEQEAGVSPWEPLPAYGPIVSIDVAWTDDTGAPRRAPLDSLLEDVRTGEALAEAGWVFVGSRYGPLRQGQRVVQTHLPDLTGNIVATYLTGEGTSLFERNSLEGIDDSLYTLHAGQAPARGTPVSLIFRATGRSTEAPPPERSDAVVLGERGERLDHWLSALVPWGFSGVVLVKEAGNVVLHQAYGLADRRTALPMSTASVFPWSAVAQEMVAVAVLQLVQRGALGLDDSLVRHLRHVPDDKAAITVRQLLEHRSGLPADVAGAATIGRAEALRALLAAPLVFPPG
ncbi:MAG: serine hydrolase, partial [Planctomycetota bacterium]